MIKVSIIVPIYNTRQYLEKCFDSLLEQTMDEIEIILVDDCSTDGSADYIREMHNSYPDKIVPIYLEKT